MRTQRRFRLCAEHNHFFLCHCSCQEESWGKNQITYSLLPNCHRPEDIEDATLLPKKILSFHSYPHVCLTEGNHTFKVHLVGLILDKTQYQFQLYGYHGSVCIVRYKVDVPNSNIAIMWSVNLRTDTKKTVLNKIGTMCSFYSNHSNLNSEHAWEDLFGNVAMHNLFKWDPASDYRHTNHLALIACFMQVGVEGKYPNNTSILPRFRLQQVMNLSQ